MAIYPFDNLVPEPEQPLTEEKKRAREISINAANVRFVFDTLENNEYFNGSKKEILVLLREGFDNNPAVSAKVFKTYLNPDSAYPKQAIGINIIIRDKDENLDSEYVFGIMQVLPANDKVRSEKQLDYESITGGKIYAGKNGTETVSIESMKENGDDRYDLFTQILEQARIEAEAIALEHS